MHWRDEAGPTERGDADEWDQDRSKHRQDDASTGPTQQQVFREDGPPRFANQRRRMHGRADAEVIRWDRVFRIKAALACGQYAVSNAAIADSLLQDQGVATQILPWMYSAED